MKDVREPLFLLYNQHIDAFSARCIALEDRCAACNGKGVSSDDHDYNKKCSHCEGCGVVLNDNGRAIIELMSFYTKSKDSDVLLARRV